MLRLQPQDARHRVERADDVVVPPRVACARHVRALLVRQVDLVEGTHRVHALADGDEAERLVLVRALAELARHLEDLALARCLDELLEPALRRVRRARAHLQDHRDEDLRVDREQLALLILDGHDEAIRPWLLLRSTAHDTAL